ncbi:carbohydrate ABC transporter permease [Sinorhizobium medicae]|uniref:carbohydrate ABC transporter permease n=1 Tax=Sinorhizobium medicae TaxID=110321 RepID=UPI001F1C260D|nr:sugar ABC transporter permease [Sinorhizobium medicae]
MASTLVSKTAVPGCVQQQSAASSRVTRVLDFFDRHFRLITIAPAALLILSLTVAPAIELVRMAGAKIAFTNDGVERTAALAENIGRLANDWIYWRALLNTLVFVITSTLAELVLGLVLALAAQRMTRAKGIVRTLMLIPILIPPVAIGNMWRLMYNPEFGIIAYLVDQVAGVRLDMLGSTSTALLAVIIVDVWHWTPFMFLILLAGLEGLPEEVMQASHLDGANSLQRLRFIVLPMLWPAIAVAFVFRSIGAFKVFDQIYLLTSGGPGVSTEVLSLYVFKVFFQNNELGYGALLSLVTIAIVCSYLAVFRIAQRRKGAL